MLKDLRKNYLVDEDDKIALVPNQCRLNILSRKVTAYSILARLDYVFSTVQTRKIPIKQYTTAVPSSVELKELGRLTNTTLKVVKEPLEDIEEDEDKRDRKQAVPVCFNPRLDLSNELTFDRNWSSHGSLTTKTHISQRSRAWKTRPISSFACFSAVLPSLPLTSFIPSLRRRPLTP